MRRLMGERLRAPKPGGAALGRVRRLAQAAQHEGDAGPAFGRRLRGGADQIHWRRAGGRAGSRPRGDHRGPSSGSACRRIGSRRTRAETAKLAALQHEYFKQLEAEAYPARTLAAARGSDGFYRLASEAVCHALAPPLPHAVKLQDDWFAPLLRNDPLNLPKEIREKIEDQPRVLRGFFAELIRHLKHGARRVDVAWPEKLKEEPKALRPHFDAVFDRYEREAWRRIDPDDPEVRVRAGFLRFLAQGGDEFAPVHERALELHGAYVAEDLDLSGCTIPQPLLLRSCYFEGQILLTETAAKSSISARAACGPSPAGRQDFRRRFLR